MKAGTTEAARRLEGLEAAFRRAGLKRTHQRREVFREVARRIDHPDAETVFLAVRKRMPTVSLDTVYRTLWLLSEVGLVSRLGPRRESVRFDANLRPHHHYVCMQCGLTRDFVSPALDAIRLPAAVRDLGSVVAIRVEARGSCATCAAAGRSAGPRRPVRAQATRRAMSTRKARVRVSRQSSSRHSEPDTERS
jgi:Fur family peroxide stress response transcriptional regulator